MKFSAVIFDLFGTLVDDFPSSVGQMNAELAATVDVPYEPFMRVWRETTEMRVTGAFQTVEASIEYVCGVLGARLQPQQMMKAVEMRLQSIRQALKPRPDAVTTLLQLRNDGCKLGLLSNCSIEIPILWPETDFAPLFDSTVFSSRERLKKPDPGIFQLACERLGAAPGDCLYVADGENHELKAAAEVGMHPVLIRSSSQETRGEVLREAREWQGNAISTLSEVLDLEVIKTNAL